MDLVSTLIVLAVALAVTALAGWQGARPPDLRRGPRLVPYRLVMVTAAALALFALVHLVNLAGVPTGPVR